jgi:uncharacterized RDD family membrane protein YckC
MIQKKREGKNMGWYYFKDDEKIGPVTKEQISILIKNDVINSDTKIWNDSTQSWKTYEEAAEDIEHFEELSEEPTIELTTPELENIPEPEKTILCDTCGLPFPEKTMTEVGEKKLCEDCRKEYFKELKSNLNISRALPYAGISARFLAKVIDGIVLAILQTVISFLFSLIGLSGLSIFFLLLIVMSGYSIFFVGKYNATLGKMIVGLEIIIPDGAAVDYKVATYRLLGEGLSSIGLYFGYFMAFFDEEKRTLHDRICNTRVVYR